MSVGKNDRACGILHQLHYAAPLYLLQSDAVFLEGDQSFFVQVTDTLLECFFADAEKIGNLFGSAFIGDGNKSILLL